MNRRESIIALVALGAVPLAAEAQQVAKVARIGYLSNGLASNPSGATPSSKGCVTSVTSRAATS